MTPKPFFQRYIRRLETRVDESGVGIVVAAHLSCGHRVAYKQRRLATSKRKTMPCPRCGAGPRTPWERAREDDRLERVIARACASPERMSALSRVLRLVIEMVATPPVTEEQRRLWDEIEVPARVSGLRDRDQGELHERGSRTLTRSQRDALIAFGGS